MKQPPPILFQIGLFQDSLLYGVEIAWGRKRAEDLKPLMLIYKHGFRLQFKLLYGWTKW